MAPIIDNELLLRLQETAAGNGLDVGFLVEYPWGTTAGSPGSVPFVGYEAMGRDAAMRYVSDEASRLGLADNEFTLLPIAAMFVK